MKKIIKITSPELKKILPTVVFDFAKRQYNKAKDFLFQIKIRKVKRNHEKALAKARKKEKLTVAFFLIHAPIWKVDGVFKLMLESERFDPVVVICPYIRYGHDVMMETMDRAEEFVKSKGYPYVKTYNEKTNTWLNVKEDLKPDLVFFTNPWRLTHSNYLINNFLDTLTCYVPYFFVVNGHTKNNYNGITHSLTWKVFYETTIHKEFAIKYARNKAENVVVTGYPGLDPFLYAKETTADPWKIKTKKVKRIIWAPHHTIEGQDAGLLYSNFTQYYNFFLELANSYSNSLQIAFKPHPLLRSKLYNDPSWGIEKTNNYYSQWSKLKNGFLVEGEYTDLFLTSDALIHDCSSFMAEYLCTGKPYLYTLKDDNVSNRMNDFGRMVLKMHYLARNKEEIVEFVESVVFKQSDQLRNERVSFLEEHLAAQNNKSASENIVFELNKHLCHD